MDANAWSASDLGSPECFEHDGLEIAAMTKACPTEPNRVNEDAVLVAPMGGDAVMLAVADGVGGHGDGDVASGLVVGHLSSLHPTMAETSGPLIVAALEQAHEELVARKGSAGSTVVVATIVDGRLRCYHAGDSALMVVGQRGRKKLRTIDHSPVGYAVEAGLLEEEDSLAHDDRHLISNFLGEGVMRLSLTGPVQLASRDTVVVASDGLFDNLAEAEITEIVRKGPLAEAAAELLARCEERMLAPSTADHGKPDDLSFVLLRSRAIG